MEHIARKLVNGSTPQNFPRPRSPCYLRPVLPECRLLDRRIARRVTPQRVLRRGASRWFPGVFALGLTMLGCGTKTSGVEECRLIEVARCRSAEQCGLIPDAAACERYVVDHCRHGFDPSIDPSRSDIQECVEAIEDVGACAARTGAKTNPADCRQSSLHEADVSRVCALAERPERIPSCRFLVPPARPRDESSDRSDSSNGSESRSNSTVETSDREVDAGD
jgi:hypothetical protein